MNSAEELEQLRLANSRLEATVQELKLEISYYKGEAKRLEWEKDVLHQDVKRMSTLFKTWIDEVQKEPATLVDNPDKINMMVKYPCQSISELLQLNDEIMFITSCQPPHFIEYANKRWSEECGWNPSEILGLTCSFLQGGMTDATRTKAFMKDIRSVGYAHMRVYNYRKSGEVFEVDVTVYPVFDSISAVGPDSEVAVLTHFASVMSDIKDFIPSNEHHHHPQQGIISSDPNSSRGSLQPTESGGSGSTDNVSSFGIPDSSSDERKSSPESNGEENRLMSSGGMMNRMFGVSSSAPVQSTDKKSVWQSSSSFPTTCGKDSNNSSGNGSNANDSNSGGSNQASSSKTVSNLTASNNGTDSEPVSTGSDSDPQCNNGSDSNPPSSSSDNGYSDTSSGLGSSDSGGNGSSGNNSSNFVDRRNLGMRFVPKCGILSENFYQFGNTLRLSNLLRLMLSSQDAMGLMDSNGRFIHVNVAWSSLTGYELNELEGRSLSVLEGNESDPTTVKLYQSAMQERRAVEVNLVHYRRNGVKFLDQMTVVPIQGGYLQPNVSHYCALCREVVIGSSSNNSSVTLDSSHARHNSGSQSNNGSDSDNSSSSPVSHHDARVLQSQSQSQSQSSNTTNMSTAAVKTMASLPMVQPPAMMGTDNHTSNDNSKMNQHQISGNGHSNHNKRSLDEVVASSSSSSSAAAAAAMSQLAGNTQYQEEDTITNEKKKLRRESS